MQDPGVRLVKSANSLRRVDPVFDKVELLVDRRRLLPSAAPTDDSDSNPTSEVVPGRDAGSCEYSISTFVEDK